jgi:hypothetical protein
MSIRVYAVAAGLLLGGSVFVAGCSDPPKQGVVTSNEFNRAHEDPYMYCGGYTTTTVNGVSNTSCSVYLIGYTHVPDQWSIRLMDDSDPKHIKRGWRGVDMLTYHKCPIDSMYPDCLANKV